MLLRSMLQLLVFAGVTTDTAVYGWQRRRALSFWRKRPLFAPAGTCAALRSATRIHAGILFAHIKDSYCPLQRVSTSVSRDAALYC